MKRVFSQLFLTFFSFISVISISYAASPTLDALAQLVTDMQTAFSGTQLGTGLSFVLLVVIFTVLFKQGTARMLPNHSRGAAAIAVALAIFGTVAILAQTPGNPLIEIGKNILFPLLLFALFAGSVAILRWINSAQVSGFGKFLMYLGFFVMFLFAFVQILGFATRTAFAGLVDAVPWLMSFLWGLLLFSFILLLFVLFIAFFIVRSIFDLFDGDDDDSALGRSRKKRKDQLEKDKNTVENLDQLKKSFHQMRNAFDDKADALKDIARMEPVSSTLTEAENIPGRRTSRRGFY